MFPCACRKLVSIGDSHSARGNSDPSELPLSWPAVEISIRSIQREEIAAAVDVLTIAFDTDPVMRHLWPNRRHRERALPRYFRATMARHHVPGGGVEVAAVAGQGIVGVAVWDPPGRWATNTPEFARIAAALMLALGHRVPAAVCTRRLFDRLHPHESHWYLCHLAVLPSYRRQGIGTALLRSRCADCDSTGRAAYLVCTRESNVPLYLSAGFATATPVDLNGAPLWPMWRPAHQRPR